MVVHALNPSPLERWKKNQACKASLSYKVKQRQDQHSRKMSPVDKFGLN